ncbi:NAD+ synthase [Nitrincola tapanii]|uniref:Glutamine-dependent NAD(+) synthetase n=1 Tax=Nitrincola tapanii TaxID=1708751 RepID=A0A5A9W6J8_9GAMM|nr:NAD+ synthase [Nitrincola tapanii]KAA0876336.1 NAD+ synthase [Nitrincola tapanii]
MSKPLRIVAAQLNFLVGDIPGNTELILAAAQKARDDDQADIIVFPELALTGYPPEDLLLRPSLETRVARGLNRLLTEVRDITLVLGYPRYRQGVLYNMAGVIRDGEWLAEYAKRCLPNYQVFDEKRYFVAGEQPGVFEHLGVRMGLAICEDLWHTAPMADLAAAEVDLVLSLNASPFHVGKSRQRHAVLKQRAQQIQAPILYVNLVGGQDELVFDGGSQAVMPDAADDFCAEHFIEVQSIFEFDPAQKRFVSQVASTAFPEEDASIWQALVLGVRDYVNKNGFKGVVLGLSGGIDSAVTAAIAVDALGPERVQLVMMPFRYTADISCEDAAEQARRMGVEYHSISIEPMYDAFMQQLADLFAGTSVDTTEQNIQARCRGVVLMALSNKQGTLVLTTGNKSEVAVGYSTLYGDMAGGFDVLKDVLKTRVYRLARYRNEITEVIPERVIVRPPSAELAPDQKDQDSLPDYEILDQILALYIERDFSAKAILAEGFQEEDVQRVIRLVDINEYKRRQAAIGPRITERGFGRDRRYPITSGWRPGD